MTTISLPEPGTYWRDTESERCVYVTGYHVEPSRTGRKPSVLVQYRSGAKAWQVGSCHSRLWTDQFTEAAHADWITQETA